MVYRFYCMSLFHFQTRRRMINMFKLMGRNIITSICSKDLLTETYCTCIRICNPRFPGQSASISTSGAVASRGYYIPNPCQPHIRYCTLRCTSGLKQGQNGCQYCACANTTTTTTSRPTTFLITTGKCCL